jgi:anti-sigma-K factor RskA
MTDHGDTRDTQPDWDNAHALSGAYAVDALDDVERARFEAHLRACPDCRTEVETFRETAAALAGDPIAPPAGLRADVLAGIEAIRPLPPLTEHGRDRAIPDETTRRPWLSGTGPLLVAAALVLVALLTTVWLQPWAEDDAANPPTVTERVLAADDREDVVDRFPDGSRAIVAISRSVGRAVALTEGLALAPAGRVYQLWFQLPKGDVVSAGLMPDQSDATVLLEGDASDATWVGITIEPDGGSKQPTTDPIASFDLPV